MLSKFTLYYFGGFFSWHTTKIPKTTLLGVNTFDYSELNSGEFVCSIESLRDFPELFNGASVSFRDINENDFKQQNIENG